jgi:hypothetical protein
MWLGLGGACAVSDLLLGICCHVSECRFDAVFTAVEVLKIAVHIFLSPMELLITQHRREGP